MVDSPLGQEDGGFEVEGEEGFVAFLPFFRDRYFMVLLKLWVVCDVCSEVLDRVASNGVVVFLLVLSMRVSIVVGAVYLCERVCFLACLYDENEGF